MRSTLSKWSVRTALLLATASPMIAFGAEQPQPIGRITAAFGAGSIFADEQARPAELHQLVNNDELITTGQGGLSVLLASRVVVKIDAHSAVRIWEGTGQTNIAIEYGTAHVFVGRRAIENGTVAVHDPNGRAACTTAVFLASYDPTSKTSYYACEEGSVRVEPLGQQPIDLGVERQLTLTANSPVQAEVATLDRAEFFKHKQGLERLGQMASQQGSEVFRLRSRTQDLNLALTSLAAAGWIDAQALAQQANAQPLTASGKSSAAATGNSGNSQGTSGQVSSGKSAGAATKTQATPAATIAAQSRTAAVPSVDTPAAREQQTGAVSTPTGSTIAAPAVDAVSSLPTAADVALPVDAGVPQVDMPSIGGISSVSSAADTGVTAVPAAADIALTTPGENTAPQIDSVSPPISSALETPAIETPAMDMALPAVATTPKIDIELPTDLARSEKAEKAKVDLPVDLGTIAPPIDIGMSTPTVTTPTVVSAPSVAVPKVDLVTPSVTPPAIVAPSIAVVTPDLAKGAVKIDKPSMQVPVNAGMTLPTQSVAALPAPVDLGVKPSVDITGPSINPIAVKPPTDAAKPSLDTGKVNVPSVAVPTVIVPQVDLKPNAPHVKPDVKPVETVTKPQTPVSTPVVTTPVVTVPAVTTPVVTPPVATPTVTPVVTTPPVVTPPVSTPVVTPPTTPVLTPPVSTPVVTTPPVVTPPVTVTPPVLNTPVVTPPVTVTPPVLTTPIVPPVVAPPVDVTPIDIGTPTTPSVTPPAVTPPTTVTPPLDTNVTPVMPTVPTVPTVPTTPQVPAVDLIPKVDDVSKDAAKGN